MRERRSGRVVFMNAIGGVLTTAFLGAYCASKHALDCIAAVYDLELRPFGVRVSSVYPSAFHTSMGGNLTRVAGEGTPYAEPTRAYFEGLSSASRTVRRISHQSSTRSSPPPRTPTRRCAIRSRRTWLTC